MRLVIVDLLVFEGLMSVMILFGEVFRLKLLSMVMLGWDG